MSEHARVRLIAIDEVAKDHFQLVLPATPALARATPGQFVNLLCRSEVTHDPLLRRPLSLYWSEGDRLGLLFRVVGRGTRLLAQLSPGDEVDLLGPLGTGFRFTHLDASSAVLLIGGGVGTPPIFHLSQRLHALGVPHRILLGFATRQQVIAVDRWHALGISPTVTTDDGSYGRKGLVTEPLQEAIAAGGVTGVFACGPRPMLRAVAQLCGAADIPAQVAMEEWMGCGVGACLSCVCPVDDARREGGEPRWARVCVEGPVFDGQKVVWER